MVQVLPSIRKAAWAVGLAAAPAICFLALLFSLPQGPLVGVLLSVAVTVPLIVAGLVLAAPAMVLLRKLRRDSVPSYLLVGFLVGALMGSVATGNMRDSDTTPTEPAAYNEQAARTGSAFGGAYGLWSSAMWCLVFRRRRRQAPGSDRAGA